MNWKAKWIWIKGKQRPRNFYLYLRKEFKAPASIKKATLHITADSRYRFFLNGRFLGQGPCRSFPQRYRFDSYEVTGRLSSGRNLIAVLAYHFGESNFQYIEGRGGFLCQLEIEGVDGKKRYVVSDKSWRVRKANAYECRTPRISCQMGFEEQFDARREPVGWQNLDFDDHIWPEAIEIGDVGCQPWTGFIPRSIPFLTMEPVYPVRIISTRPVKPVSHLWTIDLKQNFLPGNRDANPHTIYGFLCIKIFARYPQKISFYRFHQPELQLKINGKPVEFKGYQGEVQVKKGENLVLINVSGEHHNFSFAFGADGKGLQFRSVFGQSSSWAVLGPFSSDKEEAFRKIWKISSIKELKGYKRWAKEVKPSSFSAVNAWALTATQKTVPHSKAKIKSPEGLLVPNDNAAIFYPGKDQEIVLDFGRELVGFIEIELEGRGGAVLDGNLFEGIQEGRILLTDRLNNSFRYTTRQGHQVFTSFVRRGFRYLSLTVRPQNEPVLIRRISCFLNTYPVVEQGEFHCSDNLLNEVWKMGAYTTRLCMEDTFVDCPAYEQAFWVGDSRNEALVNYAAFGELALPEHCWNLVAESLERSPLPGSQLPSGWQNILTAWNFLWIIACYEFYLYSGKREFLRKIYPALRKTYLNLEGMLNKNRLLSITAWNMLDWAKMDTPDEGIITHNNAWLVRAFRAMSQIAEVIGEKDDAEKLEKVSGEVKRGINQYLWSEKDKAYIDCIHADATPSKVISQQTNTIVYLCDCATPEREKLIKGYVKDVPHGWVRVGTPFMMFFSFEALSRQGDFKTILDLIRKHWGFMLDKGATTCWEMFPGFYKDKWTRSWCHAWSAGPTYFLSGYQLGIRPLEPGFRKVLIAPEPAGLFWARGSFPTPRGSVKVSWEKDAKTFSVNVSLPETLSGEVRLPLPAKQIKTLKIKGKGLKRRKVQEGRWIIQLKEGADVLIVAK